MIGDTIKKNRQSSGMTQQQLADLLGVQRSAISKYEKGIVSPNVATIKKIASALGVTIADLMGWEEEYEFRDVPPGEPHNLEVTKKWAMNKQKARLDEAFEKLNQTGQEKAVERVEELTMIDKYTLSANPTDQK